VAGEVTQVLRNSLVPQAREKGFGVLDIAGVSAAAEHVEGVFKEAIAGLEHQQAAHAHPSSSYHFLILRLLGAAEPPHDD
jgi:hypothetical protein